MTVDAGVGLDVSALDWLRLLYPGEPAGHLVLWTRQDRRAHWFSTINLEGAAAQAVGLALRQDVYLGVGLHPRQLGEGERGRADHVCAIPGLWLDLDVAGDAHQGSDLPPTREAARLILAEFSLQPTAVVDSGHGLQAWWLFTELWRFTSPADRDAASELSRRSQATLARIGQRHGWHVDSTPDLSRVLRLPGTFNRKLSPVPVVVVELDVGRRYRPEDFEAYLEAPETVKAAAPPVIGEIAAQHRNTTLTSLAGSMRHRGMGVEAILAALRAENESRCRPPLPDHEIRAIATSVAKYSPAPVNGTGGGQPGTSVRAQPPAGDNGHSPAGDADGELRQVVQARAQRAQVDGATFVLDGPTGVDPVWGDETQVAWSSGEPLLMNGPTGVGKTTLAQELALARMGKRGDVLGLSVKPDERRVLYIAADRPPQAARSMRRMVNEEDRALLAARLVVWRGPLPYDLTRVPDVLAAMAEEFAAGTVIIDSLKDVASKLSEDDTGSKVNQAMQLACLAGVEVLALHHQRKRQQGGGKPRTLDDVYGSTWLTAGAGSVLLVWGEAGDAVVELSHLKQPVDAIGPLTLLHDHERGVTTVQGEVNLLDVVRTSNGLTPQGAARALFQKESPEPNEVERARRRLEQLCKKELAYRVEPKRGGSGGSEPARYYAVNAVRVAP